MEITLRIPAKINLYLDVTARLENGYHALETVMQSVGLYDTVTLRAVPGSGHIGIAMTPAPAFSVPAEKNTAYRAALSACEKMGDALSHSTPRFSLKEADLQIAIQKSIPSGAGLGGASADAAAVLLAISALFDTKASEEELCLLGKSIGADVPFCIHRGTVLARGIGEIITELPALPAYQILIAKPLGESVSTPYAFSEIDRKGLCGHTGSLTPFLEALQKNDFEKMRLYAQNRFTCVLPPQSRVGEIEKTLYDCHALFAQMSGSGPSLFAFFAAEEDRACAMRALANQAELYPCETVGRDFSIIL